EVPTSDDPRDDWRKAILYAQGEYLVLPPCGRQWSRLPLHASSRPPVCPQRALARSKTKSETNRPFDPSTFGHGALANATTYERDERQGNERAGMIQNPPPQNYFG